MRINVDVNQPSQHPDADAARLYGELREKAKKEVVNGVVDTFGINHELQVIRWESEYSPINIRDMVHIAFKLNGHLYKFTVDISERPTSYVMADTVANEIANQIVTQLLSKWGRR